MEDYECIKSVSALEDKEKEIREKDDLLNKAVGRIENADDNFNQLYENAKPERVNKLTEDEPKLNGLAVHLDKQMNPEFYSELEQIQEQKNQKRIEVCIYNMHI